MVAYLLEKITGKDDLERVACKEDMLQLNDYLKTRHLLVPIKPKRFLDAATFTQDELMKMIEQESKELANDQFDLWILKVDGMNRLPAFSSQKKLQAFSEKMSMELNKVFALSCVEVLLSHITKQTDIDFVDLNLFSEKSWEIGVGRQNEY